MLNVATASINNSSYSRPECTLRSNLCNSQRFLRARLHGAFKLLVQALRVRVEFNSQVHFNFDRYANEVQLSAFIELSSETAWFRKLTNIVTVPQTEV